MDSSTSTSSSSSNNPTTTILTDPNLPDETGCNLDESKLDELKLDELKLTDEPELDESKVDESNLIDEEKWPWYKPESFYPVSIGDVLHERYKVLYKIGYGTTSTVWICRDLRANNGTKQDGEYEYVCMKAMVRDYPSATREIKAYELLSEHVKKKPGGARFIRKLLDHFQLDHGEHKYHFLIHEPLGLNLKVVIGLCGGRYPMAAMNALAATLLRALEFIHSVDVVHTDISADNIIFPLPNQDVLRKAEEEETRRPSARKILGDRTVFAKRQLVGTYDELLGPDPVPVLCDFGEARWGEEYYGGVIQPAPYRAPEILLHIQWSESVDVWNLGCLLWHCATGVPLFLPLEEEDQDQEDELRSDGVQIATMATLLGPPPAEWLKLSVLRAHKFFNEDGSPKYTAFFPGNDDDEDNHHHQTLESRFASAFRNQKAPPPPPPPPDQVSAFIAFIRRALTWDDDARPFPSQLLEDPWITSGNVVKSASE